jgi:hypothetical protein
VPIKIYTKFLNTYVVNECIYKEMIYKLPSGLTAQTHHLGEQILVAVDLRFSTVRLIRRVKPLLIFVPPTGPSLFSLATKTM